MMIIIVISQDYGSPSGRVKGHCDGQGLDEGTSCVLCTTASCSHGSIHNNKKQLNAVVTAGEGSRVHHNRSYSTLVSMC